MKDVVIQLSKGVQRGPAADLIPVLFGESPPLVSKNDTTFRLFNTRLDHSQVCLLYDLGIFFFFISTSLT